MRLTTENGKKLTDVSENELALRLSQYENMYDSLLLERKKVIDQMEKLKAAGKTKSVAYNQLFADKLTLNNIIGRFEIYIGK